MLALLQLLAGTANLSSFWRRSAAPWPYLPAGARCRPDVWGRLSFLAVSSCMIFSGRIDNPNHPLGAGVEVDVLNLNGLLVTSPVSVEGLDQIELKPQQLVGVVAYARVGKLALIKHQRYAHAHQFKRANRSLRRLKTYLGRVIRDIGRRIDGDPELEEIFARPLSLSRRVLAQDQRQRGPKVYSLHAPEVECIGKGKAHRPYEFGVKVSVATTAHRSKGGQFVTHVAALPGNPYDGHTLATVIPAMEDMIGNTIERLLVDAGYRGHNAPIDYKFRVYTSGQKRRLTPQIKRELRRRAAIEPVIGHLKAEHRMGRNYLAHHAGDAVNAVLAAAGYNFHLLLKWLELLLSRFLAAQKAAAALQWV